MIKKVYRLFIELTNGKFTSGALKIFSRSKISKLLISSYASVYKVNKDEIKMPLKSFQSLHELFIRELKEGARPVADGAATVVSPVDAKIEQIGEITKTKQFTVKNKQYSIADMFSDEECANKYINGSFIVLYLSPSDYHRIHVPITGEVIKTWTLGKKSYPVNNAGLKYGKAPLSKNYRTITELKHETGHVAIAKVGAMFVNSIVTTFESNKLKKGSEMAYFTFGSTVVLFFESGTFSLEKSLVLSSKIKVGEPIGQIINTK